MKLLAILLLAWSGLVCLSDEFSGIGIALGRQGDDLVVMSVLPDSPAAQSKAIHTGDLIVAIGQGKDELEDIQGTGLAEVVGLIRGPKGTTVRLKIIPAGKEDTDAQVVSLVRGELKTVGAANRRVQVNSFTITLFELAVALARPY